MQDREKMQEKLDEIEHQIQDARRREEEDLEHHPEHTFFEPGTVDTENIDNTIVPPG
jgi:hypothetical protein